MNNKILCYFGFNVYCSGRKNSYDEVAMEIFRRLNVRWKSCKVKPPNIFIWNNIEVYMSDNDKLEMNNFMKDVSNRFRRCGKIHDLEWWYGRERDDIL